MTSTREMQLLRAIAENVAEPETKSYFKALFANDPDAVSYFERIMILENPMGDEIYRMYAEHVRVLERTAANEVRGRANAYQIDLLHYFGGIPNLTCWLLKCMVLLHAGTEEGLQVIMNIVTTVQS
jgi:hypothetical protein